MWKRALLVVTVLSVVLSGSLAQAQEKKGKGGKGRAGMGAALRVSQQPTMTRSAPKETTRAIEVDEGTTPAGGPLSEEQLHNMLKNMGYEVKVYTSEGGPTEYEVTEGGWYVLLQRSGNGSVIWVYAFLGKIPDPAKAPAEKLLGLLGANSANGFFVYMSQSQLLSIQRDVPNDNVTPSVLRRALTNLSGSMTRTNDLWKEGALAP